MPPRRARGQPLSSHLSSVPTAPAAGGVRDCQIHEGRRGMGDGRLPSHGLHVDYPHSRLTLRGVSSGPGAPPNLRSNHGADHTGLKRAGCVRNRPARRRPSQSTTRRTQGAVLAASRHDHGGGIYKCEYRIVGGALSRRGSLFTAFAPSHGCAPRGAVRCRTSSGPCRPCPMSIIALRFTRQPRQSSNVSPDDRSPS